MAEDFHEGESRSATSKEQRIERKKKKLLAEYQLSKANDAVKRPGTLLDKPEVEPKKEKLEEVSIESNAGPSQRLNDEEFKLLKKQLAERKRILTQLPRFTLQHAGLAAKIGEQKDRVPLLMSDIQHLLVYALVGNNYTCPPRRWCAIEKWTKLTNILALVVEGVTLQDYLNEKHNMPCLTTQFPEKVEVVAPVEHNSCAAKEFSSYPIPSSVKHTLIQKHGSLDALLEADLVTQNFSSIFPIGATAESTSSKVSSSLPQTDKFPRTYLLLSTNQMLMENFPLPIVNLTAEQELCSYKLSMVNYNQVTPWSPMFAIDCEMCLTDAKKLELTHIAVVNERHETIYETLVKPRNRIINYLTQYSGITPEKLRNVNKRIEDVIYDLQNLLPGDAILVGHSLNSDLVALGISHPYVIDTSIIYNLSGNRQRKSKLAHLMENFLGEIIQDSKHGHSPAEDALAAMKLVQLKLSKGFHFGDSLAVSTTSVAPDFQLVASVLATAARASKSVMVVGLSDHIEHYQKLKIFDNDQSASFEMKTLRKPREIVKHMEAAAVSHNMCIGHINLSKKISKCDSAEKRTRLFTKLDNWCERMFSAISWNGIGVVILAGPNHLGSGLLNEQSTLSNNLGINNNMNLATALNSNQDGSTTHQNSTIGTDTANVSTSRCSNAAAFVRLKSLK